MKETYPKYIVNAVVIVLVAIIIAVTFTMNSPTQDKKDCYKKVYKKEINENPEVKYPEKRIRTKIEMEGNAAKMAAVLCYGTYKR